MYRLLALEKMSYHVQGLKRSLNEMSIVFTSNHDKAFSSLREYFWNIFSNFLGTKLKMLVHGSRE
jgi:calcineurin-like phosphoesterase family protein